MSRRFVVSWSFGLWAASENVSARQPQNVKQLDSREVIGRRLDIKQLEELLRRLDVVERKIGALHRSNQAQFLSFKSSIELYQSRIRRDFANVRHYTSACCRKHEEMMQARNDRQIRLEGKLSQLRQNWTNEMVEFQSALVSLEENAVPHGLSVEGIIKQAIHMYDADKTGRADFALETIGGKVVSTRCTEPLNVTGPGSDPSVAIRRSVAPGECWAFQGEGSLVIRLSHPVEVTGCSIEHIPGALHPSGRATSAPKTFKLLGLSKETNDVSPHLFGSYIYDISPEAETVQYFPVRNPANSSFNFVELVVTSNHGHPYTCLYRIRVHGSLAGEV